VDRDQEGTPQRSVISPILANLPALRTRSLGGPVATEKGDGRCDHCSVRRRRRAGFQYQDEAKRFLRELQERMGKFGLELHPEKTRLIEFGRCAAERRKKRGEGCPEAFKFLGCTHICGTNRKTGYFTIIRQTISKRRAARLKQLHAELRRRLHDSLADTVKWGCGCVRFADEANGRHFPTSTRMSVLVKKNRQAGSDLSLKNLFQGCREHCDGYDYLMKTQTRVAK
jgi:RNA-directed DNA polymerase